MTQISAQTNHFAKIIFAEKKKPSTKKEMYAKSEMQKLWRRVSIICVIMKNMQEGERNNKKINIHKIPDSKKKEVWYKPAFKEKSIRKQ